jgi:hypothetical protein
MFTRYSSVFLQVLLKILQNLLAYDVNKAFLHTGRWSYACKLEGYMLKMLFFEREKQYWACHAYKLTK